MKELSAKIPLIPSYAKDILNGLYYLNRREGYIKKKKNFFCFSKMKEAEKVF
ncbi:hypothetical protein [Flavobacterium ajazii]|uniref:hypothetical protein n=1 Tax=Flavobacterium ajazii TaxID=2692318 RepID=UPI0013D2115D|nr:hypothetical protein [Flavobacterium ajazii]